MTNHYLKQCWPDLLTHICGTRGRWVNSLWPCDAIWWQRSGSTLTAPSHYLNQCWLIVSKVQWHLSEGNFTKRYLSHQSLKLVSKLLNLNLFKSPRGQWVKRGIWIALLSLPCVYFCQAIQMSLIESVGISQNHDVIKWKHFQCYWPFVWGIHQLPVNSPQKGQWRGASVFSLTWVWINGWVNNHEYGDLRRHHGHYDVTVMFLCKMLHYWSWNLCVARKFTGLHPEKLDFHSAGAKVNWQWGQVGWMLADHRDGLLVF